jgi:hypothetical protein
MKDLSYISFGAFQVEDGQVMATVWRRAAIAQSLSISENQLVELAILIGNDFTSSYTLFDYVNPCLKMVAPDGRHIEDLLGLIAAQDMDFKLESSNHMLQQAIQFSRDFYNLVDLSSYGFDDDDDDSSERSLEALEGKDGGSDCIDLDDTWAEGGGALSGTELSESDAVNIIAWIESSETVVHSLVEPQGVGKAVLAYLDLQRAGGEEEGGGEREVGRGACTFIMEKHTTAIVEMMAHVKKKKGACGGGHMAARGGAHVTGDLDEAYTRKKQQKGRKNRRKGGIVNRDDVIALHQFQLLCKAILTHLQECSVETGGGFEQEALLANEVILH